MPLFEQYQYTIIFLFIQYFYRIPRTFSVILYKILKTFCKKLLNIPACIFVSLRVFCSEKQRSEDTDMLHLLKKRFRPAGAFVSVFHFDIVSFDR